jgi:outer membrane protein assembly factor BamB
MEQYILCLKQEMVHGKERTCRTLVNGPAPLTKPGLFPPGANITTSVRRVLNQIDVYAVGNDGAIYTVFEAGDGPWKGKDLQDSFVNGPAPLTHASVLPMGDWFPWPHIHGSPTYFDFNNGKSMMYVWAEKDYLKAFQRLGNKFEQVSHADIIAPDEGMPGGMLSLSIDKSINGGGVIFATVPLDAFQTKGCLRAFDPMTLKELWNNITDPQYKFAKFCPPTVANGKVFLPTFSNRFKVYGHIQG